jgi:hypothetical protein
VVAVLQDRKRFPRTRPGRLRQADPGRRQSVVKKGPQPDDNGSMVDSLHESSSVAGHPKRAKRIRLRTATMIAATPVVVGLLMLSSSVFHSASPEPLDHDVPESRATAEEFAVTWLQGSTSRAIGYVAQTSGISLEQLEREREFFDSHGFEIVGPARFATNNFMGLPGNVLPLEGLQGSHRLPHTLVIVMTDDPQGWKVMGYGWTVDDPERPGDEDGDDG